MLNLRSVEVMMDPPRCLGCGRGNTPDEHGEVGPFLDTGLDVNWGDNAHFCSDCIRKIAVFWGYVDQDELTALTNKAEGLKVELHEAKSELDEYIRKYKKLAESVKVVRTSTTTASSSKNKDKKGRTRPKVTA